MSSNPKPVGSLLVSALFDNVKSAKFLDWYTTGAPEGISVDVTVLNPDESESDLAIAVSTPAGIYHRVYTLTEQYADANL